jgi:hypothetical protein
MTSGPARTNPPSSFVYISSFLPAARASSSSPLDAKGQTNIFKRLAQIWRENIDVLYESQGIYAKLMTENILLHSILLTFCEPFF